MFYRKKILTQPLIPQEKFTGGGCWAASPCILPSGSHTLGLTVAWGRTVRHNERHWKGWQLPLTPSMSQEPEQGLTHTFSHTKSNTGVCCKQLTWSQAGVPWQICRSSSVHCMAPFPLSQCKQALNDLNSSSEMFRANVFPEVGRAACQAAVGSREMGQVGLPRMVSTSHF